MIKTAEIKNFRGYQRAKLNDLSRVNLVIGENGSGKTALLESLFLASSASVEIALRLRELRGFENRFAGPLNLAEESLWRDYFYRFDKKSVISVSLQGSEYRNREMTIKFNDPSVPVQPAPGKRSTHDGIETPPIVTFDWIGPKGRRVIVKPQVMDGKIQLPNVIPLPEETFFFSSNPSYSAFETASRFSELSKKAAEQGVVEQVKLHFPQIQSLSIELIAGLPMVCAKIDALPEKVPLNLLSSGMAKIAGILFAITSGRGSVVLIDEIENGIYFKRFPIMWESILNFAKKSDAQVFVSTHSIECIKAAAEVAERNQAEFSVIQTDAKGAIFQFNGERFSEAVNEHVELR